MPVLSAAQLLGVWELGSGWSMPRRALALLAAGFPERDRGELAALSVGHRDDLLLQLREYLFGATVTVVDACPACAAALESTLRIADLRSDATLPQREYTLVVDDRRIAFHPPTAADLIDLPEEPAAARLALLTRCVHQPNGADAAHAPMFSARAIDAIEQAMCAADPRADCELAFTCPACANRWQGAFDIVQVLWREIDAWAQRILRDVHVLARSYGWGETDILALSPTRRQLYLQMCRP